MIVVVPCEQRVSLVLKPKAIVGEGVKKQGTMKGDWKLYIGNEGGARKWGFGDVPMSIVIARRAR